MHTCGIDSCSRQFGLIRPVIGQQIQLSNDRDFTGRLGWGPARSGELFFEPEPQCIVGVNALLQLNS